jgi:hypothetical protein
MLAESALVLGLGDHAGTSTSSSPLAGSRRALVVSTAGSAGAGMLAESALVLSLGESGSDDPDPNRDCGCRSEAS